MLPEGLQIRRGMTCSLEGPSARTALRGDVMAQQKRGLGKGLGALIPTAPPGSSAAPPGVPRTRGATDTGGGLAGPGGAAEQARGAAPFQAAPVGSVTAHP